MSSISQRICSVEGCDKASDGKRYCSMHYYRVRRYGTPGELTPRKLPGGGSCVVEHCDRAAVAKEMCEAHYLRVKKYGKPRADVPLMTRHGKQGSSIYGLWNAMKARCLNPAVKAYPRYGGRGITVCPEWLDFNNFYADMGDPPPGMTLDREDVNGNYEPSNCRWASPGLQAYNRRYKSELIARRGVVLSRNKYEAAIAKETKTHYIGSFTNAEEAAWMYDQWALALYGDDARPNFEYLPVPTQEAA